MRADSPMGRRSTGGRGRRAAFASRASAPRSARGPSVPRRRATRPPSAGLCSRHARSVPLFGRDLACPDAGHTRAPAQPLDVSLRPTLYPGNVAFPSVPAATCCIKCCMHQSPGNVSVCRNLSPLAQDADSPGNGPFLAALPNRTKSRQPRPNPTKSGGTPEWIRTTGLRLRRPQECGQKYSFDKDLPRRANRVALDVACARRRVRPRWEQVANEARRPPDSSSPTQTADGRHCQCLPAGLG